MCVCFHKSLALLKAVRFGLSIVGSFSWSSYIRLVNNFPSIGGRLFFMTLSLWKENHYRIVDFDVGFYENDGTMLVLARTSFWRCISWFIVKKNLFRYFILLSITKEVY